MQIAEYRAAPAGADAIRCEPIRSAAIIMAWTLTS